MAGNLHGNQQKNTKFSLTSAELHMTNFYKRRYNTGVEPAGKERSWYQIHFEIYYRIIVWITQQTIWYFEFKKIYCIVSLEKLRLGVRCFRLRSGFDSLFWFLFYCLYWLIQVIQYEAYCSVSDQKTLISESDKIADLRRLVDCNDEYKDSYLMTKEDQRRYNPQKILRIDSYIYIYPLKFNNLLPISFIL